MTTLSLKPIRPIIDNYPDEKAQGYQFYSNIRPSEAHRFVEIAQQRSLDILVIGEAFNILGDEVPNMAAVFYRNCDYQTIRELTA